MIRYETCGVLIFWPDVVLEERSEDSSSGGREHQHINTFYFKLVRFKSENDIHQEALILISQSINQSINQSIHYELIRCQCLQFVSLPPSSFNLDHSFFTITLIFPKT